MNREDDINRDFRQLIRLLKRILNKQHHLPEAADISNAMSEAQSLQMNIYIFPLLPVTLEEIEEFESFAEEFGLDEERGGLRKGLTPGDLEFLRRHGIRF